MKHKTGMLLGLLLIIAQPALAHGQHSHHGLPWCGIYMMQLTGIHGPGNLARAIEWEHIGRPALGPAPGIIGVMAHHVFKVIALIKPGEVLAISGNDGNAVRTRPRSTSGVVAWRQI